MKETTTFKTSKTPSETFLTNRIIAVLHKSAPSGTPGTSGTFPARCTQQRAKSSSGNLPSTCSRTSVTQPSLLFLFYTVVIHFCLFPNSKILIQPDFFSFISLVPTFHCLLWQTLLVLSTFNLRRAGATKSKGHIQYLR